MGEVPECHMKDVTKSSHKPEWMAETDGNKSGVPGDRGYA